jgi:hypothetical protein
MNPSHPNHRSEHEHSVEHVEKDLVGYEISVVTLGILNESEDASHENK